MRQPSHQMSNETLRCLVLTILHYIFTNSILISKLLLFFIRERLSNLCNLCLQYYFMFLLSFLLLLLVLCYSARKNGACCKVKTNASKLVQTIIVLSVSYWTCAVFNFIDRAMMVMHQREKEISTISGSSLDGLWFGCLGLTIRKKKMQQISLIIIVKAFNSQIYFNFLVLDFLVSFKVNSCKKNISSFNVYY